MLRVQTCETTEAATLVEHAQRGLRVTYVVDLPGGDVVVLRQPNVEKTLIVSEVEVDLSKHATRRVQEVSKQSHIAARKNRSSDSEVQGTQHIGKLI